MPAIHASPALKRFRVLDLTRVRAGPSCVRQLADFGADVIKIEAPGGGDAMRDWGRLRHNDRSLWWSILARNKRSVALNLREPDGQRIATELAAGADIVLENFRPGTMEKWGLGPADLHARNPADGRPTLGSGREAPRPSPRPGHGDRSSSASLRNRAACASSARAPTGRAGGSKNRPEIVGIGRKLARFTGLPEAGQTDISTLLGVQRQSLIPEAISASGPFPRP